MDVAIIAPVKDLELSNELSHLYLVLSWLCKSDPEYKDHWKNIKNEFKKSYLILDNGANEGKLSDDLDLLKIALDIKADEIVLPDEYRNAKETINKTTEFLDKYYDQYLKKGPKTMAVIQGITKDEFKDCYNMFLSEKRINIIGVGYRNLAEPFKNDMALISDNEWRSLGIDNIEYLREVLSEETFYYTLSRIYFLKNVVDYKLLKKSKKKIHLLGSWNPYEMCLINKVLNKKELKCIRGWDSACLTQSAQASVIFNKRHGVYDKPKKMLDFEKRMTLKQKKTFSTNLETLKEWLNGS